MTRPGAGSGESKLETVISYLLITGVIISLVLVVVGIVLFYRNTGHLSLNLEDRNVYLHGRDFFSFLYELLSFKYTQDSAIFFMALGIAVLILTPYVRVIASAIYFGWRKDTKYALITLFVLIILTVSLVLH